MDTLDTSIELLSSEGGCSDGFAVLPDVPGVSSVAVVTAVAVVVVVAVLLAAGFKLVLFACDRRIPSSKLRPGRRLIAELLELPALEVAVVVVVVVAMEVKGTRTRTSCSSHSISSSELVSAFATAVELLVFFCPSALRFQSIVFSKALASVLR